MKKIITIEGVDCAVCAAKLEKKIAKIRGVVSAKYSFFTQILELEAADEKMAEVLDELPRVCRRAEPDCVIRFEESV